MVFSPAPRNALATVPKAFLRLRPAPALWLRACLSRGETDVADQFLILLVTSQRVHPGLDQQPDHTVCTVQLPFLQPLVGLVLVSQFDIGMRHFVRAGIAPSAWRTQFSEQLLRFAAVSACSMD